MMLLTTTSPKAWPAFLKTLASVSDHGGLANWGGRSVVTLPHIMTLLATNLPWTEPPHHNMLLLSAVIKLLFFWCGGLPWRTWCMPVQQIQPNVAVYLTYPCNKIAPSLLSEELGQTWQLWKSTIHYQLLGRGTIILCCSRKYPLSWPPTPGEAVRWFLVMINEQQPWKSKPFKWGLLFKFITASLHRPRVTFLVALLPFLPTTINDVAAG